MSSMNVCTASHAPDTHQPLHIMTGFPQKPKHAAS